MNYFQRYVWPRTGELESRSWLVDGSWNDHPLGIHLLRFIDSFIISLP